MFALIGAAVTLVILFVIADYFSLFGIKEKEKFDLVELNFVTIDEETGAPVNDVKARCFQKNNNNACTQREGVGINSVSINIPVQKIYTHSILFEKNARIKKTADPKVHIMFIHKDYANPVETVFVDELPALKERKITIKMPKSIAE